MIIFDNVTLRYHYDDFDLLKGASFTLADGVNTVLADVQSGKGSICKLLTKDVAATSGRITVDGQDIASITNSNLDILYLPTNPAFFENRSVQYNIEYPLRVRKYPKNGRRERAMQVASELGIDKLDAKVKKLSLEERKLVALARGLTVQRKTVLFDDFFIADCDGLEARDRVLQYFDGSTCVILTSDARLATGNTVVLDGGVAVYQGNAETARKIVSELNWLVTQCTKL
ncbi:MAG: ATP-binding cassette domain-containing protein [Clostridiales bacterium]|nr:ATP-binding cassette domain-containing protein [Clostridiales bacterium]